MKPFLTSFLSTIIPSFAYPRLSVPYTPPHTLFSPYVVPHLLLAECSDSGSLLPGSQPGECSILFADACIGSPIVRGATRFFVQFLYTTVAPSTALTLLRPLCV